MNMNAGIVVYKSTIMQNIAARRVAAQYHIHYWRRRVIVPPETFGDRKSCRLSSSSKSKTPTPSSSSSYISKDDKHTNTTSNMQQIFTSLTSSASDVALKATKKASQAATEATSDATTKAKIAATKATNNLRYSVSNAKVDAKQKSEQYAWEAHRFISKLGDNIKQSAKVAAKNTGARMKEKAVEVSQSTSNRFKDEISSRIHNLPKLPTYAKNKLGTISSTKPKLGITEKKIIDTPPSTTTTTEKIIDYLPSKEQLLKSATTIATETATKTASNVTTQVSETVNKATRWVFWWGLAAVGVYGFSTTLTKEGVLMIKEMFTSSRKQNEEKSSSVASIAAGGDCDDKENIANNSSSGRWLSSWFSSRASKTGDEQDVQPQQ